MQWTLEIGPDHLSLEGHEPIRRPLHISRSRWMAFWRHVSVQGFDLLKIARFLSGQRDMTREEMIATTREMIATTRKTD